MHKQREFLLLVTLAIAPALGQAVTPATGSASSGAPSAAPASSPNFSGIWWLPGFELPTSGPGPVTNRSRLPNGVDNASLLAGDYTGPSLKPQAAEIVKKHREIPPGVVGVLLFLAVLIICWVNTVRDAVEAVIERGVRFCEIVTAVGRRKLGITYDAGGAGYSGGDAGGYGGGADGGGGGGCGGADGGGACA